MPPILDVAIGLLFIYLLFSLVVSAANEIWLSFLDQRVAFLRMGMRELFSESHHQPVPGVLGALVRKLPVVGKRLDAMQSERFRIRQASLPASGTPTPDLLDRFYRHGLINALSRGEGRPSYIAPEVFSAALLDLLITDGGGLSGKLTRLDVAINGIKEVAKTSPAFAQSLEALLLSGEESYDAYRKRLESWFSDSMDRVSGWYKRHSQQWLLLLAFVLAVACNVDSVRIVGILSADPALRTSMVKQATDYAERATPASGQGIATPAEKITVFRNALGQLGGVSIPLGWNAEAWSYVATDWKTKCQWLAAFTGWLVTALAASLGAPFWFDTLQRFINIRGNGRSPDEQNLPGKKTTAAG